MKEEDAESCVTFSEEFGCERIASSNCNSECNRPDLKTGLQKGIRSKLKLWVVRQKAQDCSFSAQSSNSSKSGTENRCGLSTFLKLLLEFLWLNRHRRKSAISRRSICMVKITNHMNELYLKPNSNWQRWKGAAGGQIPRAEVGEVLPGALVRNEDRHAVKGLEERDDLLLFSFVGYKDARIPLANYAVQLRRLYLITSNY